ncbi:MAG TPA: amino acid adenylation domain-containing protein, partial [Thermoanaerobaculia bacterium]|nr:amino acid adenylation domain-containing protein [Thermoanaerobaculia bacterium]
ESRLDAADADRIAASLLALLGAAVAEPGAALDDLEAVGTGERARLLGEFNLPAATVATAAAVVAAPEGETAHGLFARQVELDPTRPAVLWEGGRMSYGDLDLRAGRLAHRLRQVGVGPERVVGVLLTRSPEAVVAILGVLKAGGAYLPLDPAYPAERLAFMVEDAGVTALVSRREVRSALADEAVLGRVPTVLLEEEGEWPASAAVAAPVPAGAGPEHLAYIIYTSGSTGRPKGVAVTHRNLVSSTRARFAYYPQAVEAFLLVSSLSFDSSVAGFFWSLCQGGALVPARERFQLDITLLVESIARHEISHLLCLPSLYSLLLEQPGLVASPRLRAVILAGEVCPAPLVARHFERLPGVDLYDEYGPTEATVWSSVYDCAELGSSDRVPIGRPIPGARLYALGGGGSLASIGAPAELYVGGPGVARGYVGRPEVTAERFVPDPWGEAGGRLYRTGDRVRHRPDGTLEFLGRTDHQVKIRGHRVEPDEIAAALAAHPAVREAVVIAREVKPGDRRLVAFVVAPAGMPGSGALREFLAERLPEPMLPSAFMALERIPLTPNGKVDRRALAAIEPSRSATEEDYVAPATPGEQALAEIWAEVLGVERVGARDDFFRLGGDSILTIQVRALAAERGLHFTVQEIFELRTVRALAERSAGRERPEATAAFAPFGLLRPADQERLPEDAEDAYPIAALQWGMLYHDELDGQGMFRDITSYHLRLPFDFATLRQALGYLAAVHPILRTSFHLSGYSEPLSIMHRHAEVPLTQEDISGQSPAEQEQTVRAWIESERHRPLPWDRPPLLRLHVHRRSPETLQFTISEHHAILDGWSMSSLLTELMQLYLRLLDSAEVAPPLAPAAQMRDLVAFERQALADPGAREFWRGWL